MSYFVKALKSAVGGKKVKNDGSKSKGELGLQKKVRPSKISYKKILMSYEEILARTGK